MWNKWGDLKHTQQSNIKPLRQIKLKEFVWIYKMLQWCGKWRNGQLTKMSTRAFGSFYARVDCLEVDHFIWYVIPAWLPVYRPGRDTSPLVPTSTCRQVERCGQLKEKTLTINVARGSNKFRKNYIWQAARAFKTAKALNSRCKYWVFESYWARNCDETIDIERPK